MTTTAATILRAELLNGIALLIVALSGFVMMLFILNKLAVAPADVREAVYDLREDMAGWQSSIDTRLDILEKQASEANE